MVKDQEELEKHSPENRKSQFIGFPEDIKEKIDVLESLGMKKVVVLLQRSGIKDSFELFRTKVM